VPLDPGLRADGAQGSRGTWDLAGVLPPLGNRPRGSLKKARVDWKPRWSFVLQEYPSYGEASQAALVESAKRQLHWKKQACFSAPRNHPNHTESSKTALFEQDQRQVRISDSSLFFCAAKPP